MKATTFFRLMGMLLLPYVLPLGPNLFAQGAAPMVMEIRPVVANVPLIYRYYFKASKQPRFPFPSLHDEGVGRGSGRGVLIRSYELSMSRPSPRASLRGEGEDQRFVAVLNLSVI